jgi:uncharacterized protein YfiM (DUF2279 family)
MALHKLVFDTTDADTQAASSNVGAYLRASDGTLLTHTDVGGKKALDVRVAEGINVEVDLDAADDSVAAWLSDGAGNAISSTGGAIHISDAGGSLTVDATDLDIRDLAFATDSVDVSGSSVSITGDVNVTQGTSPWVVSATNLDIRDLVFATDKVDVSGSEVSLDSATLAALENITVSATDLDIRDLDAAQDSVESWLNDGAGNAITSTAGALDVNIASGSLTVNDAALADTAIKALAETVTGTAAQIVDGADELAARKYLFLYNNGSKEVYIGQTGVTVSSGFPIPPGSILEARIGAAVDIHAVSQGGSQNVRTLQLS